MKKPGLYIAMISVHGLIRGHNLELGRDADTGGQIRYVVDLVRTLAEHPDVERVDLLTRRVIDPKVDSDYAEPTEQIGEAAWIVRLPAGPRRYFRKEVLWPYLDVFTDEALQYFSRIRRLPDLLHSHYADAGQVGARLAQLLGVPLVHTGHSLGIDKRRRLIDKGIKAENFERIYNISRRIEAEEVTLGNASLVIASTSQEIEQQYQAYANYHPQRMRVIPPGLDISRFYPPKSAQPRPPIADTLARFLQDRSRPIVLAISRADERKNIATLVRAFGENPDLRKKANLVIVAGNRDDIRTLDRGSREVLSELLYLIDRYDLYGVAAIPKHHDPNDIPDLYRLAASTRGVFVNPALTEPFGLTLIEAAASGLPVVATEDGGPRDIMEHCQCGELVDPLDVDAIGDAVWRLLSDRDRWQRCARAGVRGTRATYTWEGHVRRYLKEVRRVMGRRRPPGASFTRARNRLPTVDRLLICDIDNTLLGDRDALGRLVAQIRERDDIAFGIATGRHLQSALKVLKEWDVPVPDVLVTSVGSEIHYGNGMVADAAWARHIDYRWHPRLLRDALKPVRGLKLQPGGNQGRFKLSYFVDPDIVPEMTEIRTLLRKRDLHCKLIYSHCQFLDLLPMRASKGLAIRHLMIQWGLAPERVLVAGDSGNDTEMLRGETLGVVVGNHHSEMEELRGEPRIYFAEGHFAAGVLEGIGHYDFFGDPLTCDEYTSKEYQEYT